MRIDSHQHFWKYDVKDYPWIDDSMQMLRRDFLPADLKPEIDRVGIDGTIAVQACHTVAETDWLLELAARNAFIRGVVGWAALADAGVGAVLERLADNPKLKSIRHVIQAEPDDDFILGGRFNAGIGLLSQHGLAYDILIYERHLPQTIRFVDLHPNQIFILDHIAKPRIKDHALSPWRENITELARRENVYCKLSGMATEADHRAWTPQQLEPYIDTVLEVFGPRRMMFGSDWPVCLLATSYAGWFDLVKKLSESEQERIMGGTAIQVYRL